MPLQIGYIVELVRLRGPKIGAHRVPCLLLGTVLLQLAIQSRLADAEQARSQQLVPVELLNRGQDRLPLNLGHGKDLRTWRRSL